MKRLLPLMVLLFAPVLAHAHGAAQQGPNQGRLLDLAKDRSLLAEVTVKEGAFHLRTMDRELKTAPATGTLTAVLGDRSSLRTLKVETTEGGFRVEKPAGAKYHVIFSYKATVDDRAMVVRLPYDEAVCGGCKKAEWLCGCH